MNPFKFAKKPLIAAVVLLLSLLVACGPAFSIHPLFTDKDVVFDAALLGTWVDPSDDRVSFIFERDQDNSYEVITRLDDTTDVQEIFEAHLVKIGGRLFLDAVQVKNRIAGKEMDLGLAIPAHVLARVSIEGDALFLSLLDQKWMEGELASGRISIPHEEVDGSLVLTASTADLQKFVLDHAHDENVFSASNPLQRKK